MCQPKKKELLSDYDCSITKSWEKKSNRRKNQTAPQLREQPNQTVPPLKVLSKEAEATAQFVLRKPASQKVSSEVKMKSRFTQGQAENHLQ
jgi:hypothetical protein